MKKQTQEILNKISAIIIHLGLLVIVFYVFLAFFPLTFYIHEGGHMAFGFMNNLITSGTITKFNVTDWSLHPLFKFIKLPQRTAIVEGTGNGSLNFVFGGIITMFLISAFVAYNGYKFSKRKLWFLLPMLVLATELTGNYFCGTDNLTSNTLPACEQFNLNVFVHYAYFLLAALMTAFVFNSSLYKKAYNFILNIPIKIHKRIAISSNMSKFVLKNKRKG